MRGGGGDSFKLGSYHVLNLVKAGEQHELGGSFPMFQTSFRPGSDASWRVPQSRHIANNKRRTPSCFRTFSGRAMLFGALTELESDLGGVFYFARPGWAASQALRVQERRRI